MIALNRLVDRGSRRLPAPTSAAYAESPPLPVIHRHCRVASYLYKDDIMLILGYQIDLTIGTAKVPLTDTISPAHKCLSGQTLTCPTQSLTCRLFSSPTRRTVHCTFHL